MPVLSEVRSALSRYAGAGNVFVDRLNECRARLLQSGSFKGTKQQIALTVYADADGASIVTLPRSYEAILAGAVTSSNVLCTGMPMGVRNAWNEFDQNGLGYGGLTNNFQEVTGRFAVFQEWSGGMLVRLRTETSESAGVIHLNGIFDGSDVYSLYSSTWIKGEKIDITGNDTFTSTKKFEAKGFSAVKPVTLGRIFVSVVDDDGNETDVGVWEPSETVPRQKRYKVPQCADATTTTSTSTTTDAVNQSYTKNEFDSMFNASTSLSVSTTGTTDLAYAAFFLRVVKIVAAAGSGAYTRKYTLSTSNAKNGATFRIKLEIAASANPTLQFYNDSISGTLLQAVAGDSSQATYVTLVFGFNSVAWEFEGREV